ncbi:MAG: MFS transporter, partial [Myxococcales bacterium]|nr:MFS transporter [Myxococcales bacterium]
MAGLPNLLGSRRGRMAAFFALYITEGIPLGFAATAVATQLRRMGVGPAEIGGFVASFYLPWAFKWVAGPLVDVFRSARFGHKRGWILLMQVMMVATILLTMVVELPRQLWLFTAILLVHNCFAAVQDVAIDSLAVSSLKEDERGIANGLMFAGASLGQAIGGAGVLFVYDWTGFRGSVVLVALAIMAVTATIVLPMKEALAGKLGAATTGLQSATAEMRRFAVESFRSFFGSRAAFSSLFFSLLPAGAMALGISLQSALAVEIGMTDDEVALLSTWSLVVSGTCMVIGGWLSDRLG